MTPPAGEGGELGLRKCQLTRAVSRISTFRSPVSWTVPNVGRRRPAAALGDIQVPKDKGRVPSESARRSRPLESGRCKSSGGVRKRSACALMILVCKEGRRGVQV
jgi:hypothetical protein